MTSFPHNLNIKVIITGYKLLDRLQNPYDKCGGVQCPHMQQDAHIILTRMDLEYYNFNHLRFIRVKDLCRKPLFTKKWTFQTQYLAPYWGRNCLLSAFIYHYFIYECGTPHPDYLQTPADAGHCASLISLSSKLWQIANSRGDTLCLTLFYSWGVGHPSLTP